MKKGVTVILILLVLWLAWYLISPAFISKELNEKFPQVQEKASQSESEQSNEKQANKLIGEANFVANAHEVRGKVLVIETEANKILRFEDFNTINGPNLHVYLASDLDAKDFVDLGPLKATKGNFNYELSEVDLTRYNKVLVWCVPFKVLFSYAEF